MPVNSNDVLIKRIKSLSDITPDRQDFIYTLDSRDGAYSIWKVLPSTIRRKDIAKRLFFYIAGFEFDAPISFKGIWHHDRPAGINATAIFRMRINASICGEGGLEQWLAANHNCDELTIGGLVDNVHSALEAYFKCGIDANSLDLILRHRFEAFVDSKRDAERLLPKWLELIETKDLYATPLPTDEEVRLEEEKRHRTEQARRLRDIDDQLNIQIALEKLDEARKEYNHRREIRDELHKRALEEIENARRRDELDFERCKATTDIEKERLRKAIAETEEVYSRIEIDQKRLAQEIKESNHRIIVDSWCGKLLHSTYSHIVLGFVLVGVVIVSVTYVFRPRVREEMLQKCDKVEAQIRDMKGRGYSELRFGFTNDIVRIRRLCDSQSLVFNALEVERLWIKVEKTMMQLEDVAKDIDPGEREMVHELERMHGDLMHQIELMPDELSLRAEIQKLSSEMYGCMFKFANKATHVMSSDEYRGYQKAFEKITEFDYVGDLKMRMDKCGRGYSLPNEILERTQVIIRRLNGKGRIRDSDYFKIIVEGNRLCDAMEAYPSFKIAIEKLRDLMSEMKRGGHDKLAGEAQKAECSLTNETQQAIRDNRDRSFWTNLIAKAEAQNKIYEGLLKTYESESSRIEIELQTLSEQRNWKEIERRAYELKRWASYPNEMVDYWLAVAKIGITDAAIDKLIREIEEEERVLRDAIWSFDNNQTGSKMSEEGKRKFAAKMKASIQMCQNVADGHKDLLRIRGIDAAEFYFRWGLLLEYMCSVDRESVSSAQIRELYDKAVSIGESSFRMAKIYKYDLYGRSQEEAVNKDTKNEAVKWLERGLKNKWLDGKRREMCKNALTATRGF